MNILVCENFIALLRDESLIDAVLVTFEFSAELFSELI